MTQCDDGQRERARGDRPHWAAQHVGCVSDKLAILNASMDFMEHKQEICQRMRNLRVDTSTRRDRKSRKKREGEREAREGRQVKPKGLRQGSRDRKTDRMVGVGGGQVECKRVSCTQFSFGVFNFTQGKCTTADRGVRVCVWSP